MTTEEMDQIVIAQAVKTTEHLISLHIQKILLAANEEENDGEFAVTIKHTINVAGKVPHHKADITFTPSKVKDSVVLRGEDPDQMTFEKE